MNAIQSVIEFIKSLLVWWFIVEPWEQAVRVRFGKNFALVFPGVHFKYPFFDIIYKQNIRKRISSIPAQTLTTKDGKTLTLNGAIGYSVKDVLKLHQTLHDAEATIKQEVQGFIGEYVATHNLSECTPRYITDGISVHNRKFEKYGLSEVEFFLTGYICGVRTYRLIQDPLMHMYNYGSDSLNTKDSIGR